ncbi:NtaA/DmoA family FMN-dependent monooxygenase [Microbacterium terregens]|uniref:NtaA/DmoA family FMN-dependent monooxygenase n=1 Tax=Microbacterium terregens TaxID=69363 RepID=A0ABV5T4W2_9MICO
MSTPRGQMVLTMFMLSSGFQMDSWRDPRSRSEEIGELSLIADMATAAERAKLHAVFFGDGVDVGTIRDNNIRNTGLYEPISSMGALIGATDKIGLVGSVSTTFSEPYNVARQLTGLDRLSGGRVGWNIVTSLFGGYQNFGQSEMPSPEARYRRAQEFVDVALKLWDSWSDDAVLNDRVSGQWADISKIRDIDYEGEHFSVKGALNMPRSPQGHPVLFQAGQSPAGLQLGASVADAIYTAQPDLESMRVFSDRVRAQAVTSGRDPGSIKILPGVVPIVGRTAREAEELSQELESFIDLVAGRRRLSFAAGISIDDLDLEESIPAERFVEGPQNSSRWHSFRRMALEEGLTVRQMIVAFARAGGHRILIGSAEDVARDMIDWFDRGVCDGFNLDPPSIPDGMNRMLELLVPLLQERGYFQTDYTGDTLRERMGFARPAGR